MRVISPTRGHPPKVVVRCKELADLIRGQELLFKARNYIGPVHVDEAACSYRWFRLKMTTRPWHAAASPRVLQWEVPPKAIRQTDTRAPFRAYDSVGMLIHDRKRIEYIEALRSGGASLDDLLHEFNYEHSVMAWVPDFAPRNSSRP